MAYSSKNKKQFKVSISLYWLIIDQERKPISDVHLKIQEIFDMLRVQSTCDLESRILIDTISKKADFKNSGTILDDFGLTDMSAHIRSKSQRPILWKTQNRFSSLRTCTQNMSRIWWKKYLLNIFSIQSIR